ncbi:MAG: hypothetical protein HY755_06230 [Nitrospirae bacterium]|nr:hypothetical protein [Nitrospirota bacterium]
MKTKKLILCLIIGLLLNIVWNSESYAAIKNVVNSSGQPSCEAADVQTAINIASDGDTVFIPAGSCTWDTQVTVPNTKGIILMGAGVSKTTIIHGTGSTASLKITGAEGKPFVVTGFTYDANYTAPSTGIFNVVGDCKNFRIHHMTMKNNTGGGRFLHISGYTYGVIDHVTFDNDYMGIGVYSGDATGADAAWERPLTLGTANAVYIEDCTFTQTGATGYFSNDGYHGARVVFRYNTVINEGLSFHGYDTGARSIHSWEIYNNTFTVTSGLSRGRAINIRGGTGVIFNNTITGNYTNAIIFDYYRSCTNPDHVDCGGSTTWGQCQTLGKGRCDGTNPADGNQDSTGYPCKDQHGRTTDADLNGIQDSSPVYEWNNTINGADADISINTWNGCANPAASDHLQSGRDYNNDTEHPTYTSYTYPHPLTKTPSKPESPR